MFTQAVAFFGLLAIAAAGHLHQAEVYAAPIATPVIQPAPIVLEKRVERPVVIESTRTVPVVHEKHVPAPYAVPVPAKVFGTKGAVIKTSSFIEHRPEVHETRVDQPVLVETTRTVPTVHEKIVQNPIIGPVTTGYVQRPVVSEAKVAVTSTVAEPVYARAQITAHAAPAVLGHGYSGLGHAGLATGYSGLSHGGLATGYSGLSHGGLATGYSGLGHAGLATGYSGLSHGGLATGYSGLGHAGLATGYSGLGLATGYSGLGHAGLATGYSGLGLGHAAGFAGHGLGHGYARSFGHAGLAGCAGTFC